MRIIPDGRRFRIVCFISHSGIGHAALEVLKLSPKTATTGLTIAQALKTGEMIENAMAGQQREDAPGRRR